MSATALIVETVVVTLVALTAMALILWSVRAVWKWMRDMLTVAKALRDLMKEGIGTVGLVQGELAYMRSLTQSQLAGQEVAVPSPPVGRVSQMPPAFPTRPFETYPVEPAKPEDTDHSLLEQTDEEVMQAQEREEARARGLELEDEDAPQPAVREEA